MKITANAVVEVGHCDNCGAEFYRSRSDHRFCSITCVDVIADGEGANHSSPLTALCLIKDFEELYAK